MMEVLETPAFATWIHRLRDAEGKARILKRIENIRKRGQFGDHEPVGDGVSELRFFFGPGYRVYYVHDGETVIILLGGGDKSSQERDIKRAKLLARSLK